MAGIAKPITSAMSRMIDFFGLICPNDTGSSMSLPLSAVAASEIEFSSRFCKSIR